MKKLLLLFAIITLSLPVWGKTKIGDLYYDLFDNDNTARVTYEFYEDNNNYSYLTGDLTIPESVDFNGKTYSVTRINIFAFLYCPLTSVTIPNSVESIEYRAFALCVDLRSVTIGNSVRNFGSESFAGCISLTNVEIGNSITNISNGQFWYCPIETITFNCPTIGDWFKDFETIKTLTIGNSVTAIESNAFENCPIETLNFNCPAIWGWFQDKTTIKTLNIGNSVTSIESNAFKNCPIETLNINCPTIKDGFQDKTTIKTLTIGNSVTSIETFAFRGCSGLASLYIGENVSSIGSIAFADSKLLEEIVVAAMIPPTAQKNIFSDFTYTYATLFVPEKTMNSYKVLEPWENFFSIKTLDEFEENKGDDNGSGDDNAVENVYGESGDAFDVYTLQGVCVKRQASQCEIDALNPGLYIINGKKVFVR